MLWMHLLGQDQRPAGDEEEVRAGAGIQCLLILVLNVRVKGKVSRGWMEEVLEHQVPYLLIAPIGILALFFKSEYQVGKQLV